MPTTPEQRASARRQDQIIQRAAAPLRAKIAKEKNFFIRLAAESYRRTGHFSHDHLLGHEHRIRDLLEKYYLAIGRLMNREISASIKSQRPGLEVKEQSKFEYSLKKWAREQAGRKAKPISSTTQADINRAVVKAFKDESPEAVVIKEILGVRGYSAFRADTIARTETHNAAMFASMETSKDYADQEGVVMLKIWAPTVDDRSREFHLEMEDHPPILMSEMFDVPSPDGGTDSMDRPGDDTAPAAQTVNCRCVLTYEVR